jgi:endonuclease YncB( thermonuclease family)
MRRILFAFIVLLTAVPALAADFTARVVGVTDGDTITVLTPERSQVKIRMSRGSRDRPLADAGGRR